MTRLAERFQHSEPVAHMLSLLSRAGRDNFREDHVWEVSLCAIILAIEPHCKLQRILEALPYSDSAMDEADILNTMAHLGYVCVNTHTTLDTIDARLLPGFCVSDKGDPFIVLGYDEQKQLTCYDPVSTDVRQVTPFEGKSKIWFFQPYDEHRQATSKFMRQGSGHSWFRALLGRFKGTFVQIMTAGLILNIITLATPIFIMIVYDRVIAAGSIGTLPMLALGAVIAIGFEWKMRSIRSTGLSWLAGRLDNIVGNKIFTHLTGLSPSLIEKASVASQLARIKTFESVRDFFSSSAFLSLLEAPFIILAIGAVTYIAGALVMVPLTIALGYIALFFFIRQQVKLSIRMAAKASSVRQQFTIETFDKLEGIRVQGLSAKWQEKFRHLSGREMMAHFHLGWLGMIAESLGHALTVLAAVATVGFGVQMIWDGDMTTGSLVATMILVWRILTPFYALCTMVPRLEQLRNSIHQVNKLIDIDTEAEEARSYSRLPNVKGRLVFDKVGFHYGEEGDHVFSGLSFEARAGDLVTITGSNGSGKATVLKIAQALHPISNGSVRIDGFDIRQLDAPDLRRQIAYVPKVAHVFSGTLIENLRFANPLASIEDIQHALELADVWQEVQKLEGGLYAVIGTGGVSLTASLRTRLSLARAYLHPANILLIDELPNALLSGQAGKNLKDYLARIKGKRTVVFCTYREDFMQLADTIIWLRGSESPLVGSRDILSEMLMSGEETIRKGVAA